MTDTIAIIDGTVYVNGGNGGAVSDVLSNWAPLSEQSYAAVITQSRLRKDELDALVVAHDTLQTNHDALTLQLSSKTTAFDTLTAEKQVLQTSFDLLAQENKRLAGLIPPPLPPRTVTANEFKARFTDSQLAEVALRAAADVNLQLLLLDVLTRTTVSLDDPKTIAGLQYLVQIGVIADLVGF